MANKFNMKAVVKKLEMAKKELPSILANDAVNFFDASFKKQGWDDVGVKKWKPRKKVKGDSGRSILVSTGALRRSIKIKSVTISRIVIGSNLPYSQIHNEGFKGKESVKAFSRRKMGKVSVSSIKTKKTKKVKGVVGKVKVRAHTRKMNMPQRQFMGDSKTLREQQIKKITKAIDSAFK